MGDYSLWFTESKVNKLATMRLARLITEFTVPTPRSGLFTETAAGKIGTITPFGAVKECRIRRPISVRSGVAARTVLAWRRCVS